MRLAFIPVLFIAIYAAMASRHPQTSTADPPSASASAGAPDAARDALSAR
jgi:hypothetical protein